MKPLRLSDLLFLLALFAFEVVGVRYLDTVFTTNTRWAVLVILAGVLFISGDLFQAYSGRLGATLAAYAVWCVMTTGWSIVPELSLLKSVGFIVTSTVFISAGLAWSRTIRPNGSLVYLAPILAVALFAGYFDRGEAIQMGNIQIYQGLTGNPNYLGMLEAQALPLSLWLLYSNWKRPLWRAVWIGLTVALTGALWLAGSRSAILGAMAVCAGGFVALGANRRLAAAVLVCMAAVNILVFIPAVQHSISTRVINKGQAEGGVFYSRQNVWAESYDNAREGGIAGVGYGATVGKNTFSMEARGLTAIGYGREKGNSQLAVWEETGLIGLTLYGLLVTTILIELAGAWRFAQSRAARVELGLLIGALIGFFFQSIFEAWWVSPGSPEFAYFFATLGVAWGVTQRLRAQAGSADRPRQVRRTGRMPRPSSQLSP